MSNKKFGFELLWEQTSDFVFGEFDYMKADSIGDSEIERLLFLALMSMSRFGATEYTNPIIAMQESFETWMLKNEDGSLHTALIIRPQAEIGNRRVDFLIHTLDQNAKKWRKLIVECDGHDFHERTKEQATRDRSRDRLAVMDGYDCFRFTGSEIWRDPWGCAEEIFSWAAKGWLRPTIEEH